MPQAHNYLNKAQNEAAGMAGRLGITGLYLFSFGAWLHKGVAIAGISLMLVAAWLDRKAILATVKHSPLVGLTLALGFYILARTLLSLSTDSVNSALHLKDGLRIFYLCGFLLIAWHMAASQKRIITVFAVAFAGFLIARLWHFDWSFSATIPWWKLRQGLGLPEIAFGYYATTAMLGLLIFFPRVYGNLRSSTLRTAASIIWILLIAMTAQGIVFSQSRSVWLSLLVVTPALLFALWKQLKPIKNTAKHILIFLMLSCTVALIFLNQDTLMQRMTLEHETYTHVLSGDFENISSENEHGHGNSVGARLVLFKEGIEHWLDNPLFGKGPAASKIILHKSDDAILAQLNDWHNAPIDILVRYGLTGLLLMSICLWMTLRAGWRAYRHNRIDGDLFLFCACGMALIILSMLTNFRMLNNDWRYWLFLLSGALASFELHQKILKPDSKRKSRTSQPIPS